MALRARTEEECSWALMAFLSPSRCASAHHTISPLEELACIMLKQPYER